MPTADLEQHIKANPAAERNAETLRAGLAALEQLRAAGIESDGYDLVSAFGGLPHSQPSFGLAEMKMGYSR